MPSHGVEFGTLACIFVPIHGLLLYKDATDLLHSLAFCFAFLATRSFISFCSLPLINLVRLTKSKELKEIEQYDQTLHAD